MDLIGTGNRAYLKKSLYICCPKICKKPLQITWLIPLHFHLPVLIKPVTLTHGDVESLPARNFGASNFRVGVSAVSVVRGKSVSSAISWRDHKAVLTD
jgi:hypothetical protein